MADGAWDPNTTVEYNFNTSETHKAIAEACGHDWETVLGMKINLANQEWATYTNGLGEHKFGVARLGWIADYNDPITYLELLVTGNSYNYGLYENPAYDEKITNAKAMLAGADRDKLLYEAEEALFGEGGFQNLYDLQIPSTANSEAVWDGTADDYVRPLMTLFHRR